jgi:hypothetical protein
VGGFHAYGLAEGGIDYAVNDVNAVPRLLSDPIRLRLDELIARVAAGEIVVPTQPEIAPEPPVVPTVAPTAPPTAPPTSEATDVPNTPTP